MMLFHLFFIYALLHGTMACASLSSDDEVAADPLTHEPSSDIDTLKAQVEALQRELMAMKGQLPARVETSTQPTSKTESPQPAPAHPQPHGDDDVQAIINDMHAPRFADAHHAPEEQAMKQAYDQSPHLNNGELYETFHELKDQYEALARGRTSPSFKADAQAFIHECRAYIAQHQADPTGRSALYLCARMLLATQQLKDAQKAFAQVYRGDEEGPHAAEALLGMAEVLLVQGQKPAALKFLEKVHKDFAAESLTEDTHTLFQHIATQAGSKLTLKKAS